MNAPGPGSHSRIGDGTTKTIGSACIPCALGAQVTSGAAPSSTTLRMWTMRSYRRYTELRPMKSSVVILPLAAMGGTYASCCEC
jgi:hypothetical protein